MIRRALERAWREESVLIRFWTAFVPLLALAILIDLIWQAR